MKYDLEHLELFTPDPAMLDDAFKLVTSVTDSFGDEGESILNLKSILGGLLVDWNKWQKPTADKSVQPVGVWLVEYFAYLIVKLKNVGLGGGPFLQGLVIHSKITAQEEVSFWIVPLPNSFPPTESHRTVRPIPRAVQHACHYADHCGELSHHIDCYLHQHNIC